MTETSDAILDFHVNHSLEYLMITRGYAIPPVMKVCLTLHFLATGSFQQTLSAVFKIDQSSVSRCYWEVLVCMRNIYNNLISIQNDENVMHEFFILGAIPDVIGAVDCTHISIVKPHRHGAHYINRKNYCSINVQAINY